MRSLLVISLLFLWIISGLAQPVFSNPDGTIVVGGSGNILKRLNSARIFDMYCVQGATIDNWILNYRIKSGANVWVHGGYSTSKLTADGNNQSININFRSVDTNKVIPIIMWGDLDSLERFSLGEPGMRLDIKKLEQCFPNMYELAMSNGRISSSNLADIPKQVTILSLTNNLKDFNDKAVHGNLDDLPDNMTSINIQLTGDSISGQLINLPRTLTSLSIRFSNNQRPQVRGNLSDLPPNLQTLFLWELGGYWNQFLDTRKIKGSLADIPRSVTSLTLMNVFVSITGGYADLPPNLTNYFSHQEMAWIENDSTPLRLSELPRSITSLSIQYTDKLSGARRPVLGTIADLPPNLTSLTLLDVDSMITGNIEDLPASLTSINFAVRTSAPITSWGYNKITYNGGAIPVWGSGTSAFTFRTCMSPEAVDNFLINYAPIAGTNTRTINISGIRTSASDAAVLTLQSKNKTIVTNNTGCP